MKLLRSLSTLAFVLAISARAGADESLRGRFYLQGTAPLGLHYWNFPGAAGYGWAGWRPDFEFGVHISERHEGLVLGIRQAFIATASNVYGGHAGGTTHLRAGWDFPFMLGDFELSLAPYGTIGVGYIFDGPTAGLSMTWGMDTKLFLKGPFYAFARPVEIGFSCLHDLGTCAVSTVFGAGVGVAFPSPD